MQRALLPVNIESYYSEQESVKLLVNDLNGFYSISSSNAQNIVFFSIS